MRSLSVAGVLVVAAVSFACSDDIGSGGSGGTAGSAGAGASGGSSGSGGSAGAGATGGSSGSSGAGGSGGSSGSSGSSGASGSGGSAGGACFDATRLWFDDFETGDYSRWTGQDYGNDWKNGFCHANAFNDTLFQSPGHSHRSEITCVSDESHRGYGGVQFDGDTELAQYTNQGSGIEAQYGVVNTYWSHLQAPYAFENGKWFSFWTVNNDCGWANDVITLGLEDTSNRLTPAHIKNTGGTVTFEPNAPGFPMGQWVRTTIYINYHSGEMVVWQDGAKILEATFSRPDTDICQWHWGAYASSNNDDVVLHEDDNSIWKLNEPWTDFSKEPYFGVDTPVCNP